MSDNAALPGVINALAGAQQIGAGWNHSCGVFAAGDTGVVKCWGNNDFGQVTHVDNNGAGGSGDMFLQPNPLVKDLNF